MSRWREARSMHAIFDDRERLAETGRTGSCQRLSECFAGPLDSWTPAGRVPVDCCISLLMSWHGLVQLGCWLIASQRTSQSRTWGCCWTYASQPAAACGSILRLLSPNCRSSDGQSRLRLRSDDGQMTACYFQEYYAI